MATGQSLLDRMELLNQELQLQAGEADVTKGLLALNVAQDYFEMMAALRSKIFGSTKGTVTTAISTETTAYPTGLLRLDRLQLLDSNSRPMGDVKRLIRAGGHVGAASWPLNLLSASTGLPQAYWTDGTLIYWAPLPSAVSTIRWYGFQAASDLTASGTFAYPDVVMLPIVAFAVRLYKSGIDDPVDNLTSLAVETFKPVLDLLANSNRDGAVGLEYTQFHSE